MSATKTKIVHEYGFTNARIPRIIISSIFAISMMENIEARDIDVFEDKLIADIVVNSLETPLLYQSTPEEVRKNNSTILYAFIFQCWIDVNVKNGEELISKPRKTRMLKEISAYITADDPLMISSYYSDGKLNDYGKHALKFQPLTELFRLVENEVDYQRLVKKFQLWINDSTTANGN